MIDSSWGDLAIYQKVNDYINEGLVTPFEEDLLIFLASHTDSSNKKVTSYLSALNSDYSISRCYRFARYLALGMDQPFHLYEGKLGSLDDGDFTHAWIETEDSVYDVSFIGKWPKELYYQLFQPVVEEDINLEKDDSYINYKNSNTRIPFQQQLVFLQYIDWYNYIKNEPMPNPFGIRIPYYPSWNFFPQDSERVEELSVIRFIQEEWDTQKTNDIDSIPSELFSLELSEYIDTNNFIVKKDDLYKELIKFIVYNRDLYDEKKGILYDISLWRKAVEGKYSGSFCRLISDFPNIINQIKEKEEKSRK